MEMFIASADKGSRTSRMRSLVKSRLLLRELEENKVLGYVTP